jgi:hypothetical protein
MLVSVCLLCSNLNVHYKLENTDQQDISDFKSVAKRLNVKQILTLFFSDMMQCARDIIKQTG